MTTSMKRWLALGLFLTTSLIVLTACGDSGSQTSTSTSSQSSTSTSSQNSAAKDVHIVMTEMKIESDVTTFTHGVSYHFIIENKGNMQHEFEIANKVAADATEQQHDAASLKELQRLDPGKTQTLDYTFANAATAGKLELECGMAGHYMQGMHMDITVA
jgi:uncharacterized cupredoxin-like copper-binding protein